MLALPHIFIFFILSVLVVSNTEKTIFVAPDALTLPSIRPGLDDLHLAALAPDSHHNSLRSRLRVSFPTDSEPRGSQHWYILDGLKEGRRYEVRVCWAATQPTEFWITTYPLQEVFETPALISSLAAYSEQQRELSSRDPEEHFQARIGPDNSTILFLQIYSSADFYTTNLNLMSNPPLVDVDIILDPYILNVLPRSLVPTVVYIVLLTISSWYLAGAIWRWVTSIEENSTKEHHD